MADQREPRYRIPGLTVVYDTGEAYWSGPVINVSAGGLFIETSHQVAVGTRLTLMLQSEDARVPFSVSGIVVRLHELDPNELWDRVPGIAFMLEGLDPTRRAKLDAFLRERGKRL